MRTRIMLVRDGPRREGLILATPEAAFAFLRPRARRLDRETLWRLDLDARNALLGFEVVAVGSLTAAIVHPREVLKGAILANAAGFILSHNHVSLDPAPSPEDRETTKRIHSAGALLGVPMIDHIIVAGERFYSFRHSGLL